MRLAICITFTLLAASAADMKQPTWPQFRGPEGRGVADDQAPPSEFGPKKNVLWKTALPSGHGSPCIWGNRIFVTAFDKEKQLLEVVAVDRKDGKIAWRKAIDAPRIEKVHVEGNVAASTPVSDGKHVFVYVGSFGLIAYDFDGKVIWQHPIPIYEGPYGSGTSPVLAGELVLVSRDYPPDPTLIAVNKKDGSLAWKADLAKVRLASSTAHSTPLIWKGQVVLNRPTRVSGHSLKDGSELWRVASTAAGDSTLTAEGDTIYAALYNMGSEPGARPEKTPWSAALAKYDKDHDGKLSKAEVPTDDLYFLRRVGVPDNVSGAHFNFSLFFNGLDQNKDGFIDETEYDNAFTRFGAPAEKNGLMAIRPEGSGDITPTAVLWNERRGVPEVPSPISYRGQVVMVASGGVLTVVDAKDGKVLHRTRLNALGTYYASPVAAGGKILVCSSEGIVTVFESGTDFKLLASNDLGERIYGTPAILDSKVYVRTASALWAFGTK